MNLILMLLAAGDSKRFGGNKLFHMVDGKKMYLHLVDEFETLTPPIFTRKIVVSQYAELLEDLEKRGYETVENHHSEKGISHSIFLGMQAISLKETENGAICFAVCDQPYLTAHTVASFINTWKDSGKGMGCLSYQGQMGNPVVFSAKYIPELSELQGDVGGKRVVKRHLEDLFLYEVEDGKELEDIDLREMG